MSIEHHETRCSGHIPTSAEGAGNDDGRLSADVFLAAAAAQIGPRTRTWGVDTRVFAADLRRQLRNADGDDSGTAVGRAASPGAGAPRRT